MLTDTREETELGSVVGLRVEAAVTDDADERVSSLDRGNYLFVLATVRVVSDVMGDSFSNESVRKKKVSKSMTKFAKKKQSWKTSLPMQSRNRMRITVLWVLPKVQLSKWKHKIQI